MRRWHLICVAAVAVSVAMLGAGTATANFRGSNGLIAFDSWTGTSQDIGVFDPSGSGFTMLTSTADFSERAPRWSPDGTKIAYVGHHQIGGDDDVAKSDIWVMNADGHNRTQLTNTPLEEALPAWTADGRIVYCGQNADNPATYDIYLMNADGTDLHRLTDEHNFACYPRAAPSGNRILFTSYRSGVGEIYVMNLNGLGQRKVTEGYQADWSPSGNDIVFNRDFDVWTCHSDGTGLRQLTNTPNTETYPSWSPDGTTIVFGRIVSSGVFNIYSIDPVTGAEQLLLSQSPPMTYSVAFATWQPLGNR